MIDACAQIAATLHTAGIALGSRRRLDDELAALREGFVDVQRISPELGAQFHAWLDRIDAYSEESDPLAPCFSHGDFTYTQLIFDNTTSGLVDFDTVCQAEPALDLGQFLAYLRVAALKARKSGAATSVDTTGQLAERFIRTYIEAAGERLEDKERLQVRTSVYQVISLLRMALHSWQKLKGARIENVIAVLEEEMACLPQLNY
jgi:aminoglycoside phosphotransferase (APT) family kinase protein